MTSNKTQPTAVDPTAFIAAVEHPTRQADATTLLDLMGRITGYPARMWGRSIVGFGRYQYRYESGRKGESMVTGFSPRKASLVVYVVTGDEEIDGLLARLGKHRIGKSCLYINRLDDIDLAVLEAIVTRSVATMSDRYDISPE